MSESTRTLDAATLDHLQSWVGRTETLTDDITAGPVRGLSATLDRDDAPPQDLGGQVYTVPAGDLRLVSHKIADYIHEKLTGDKGVFSTRIAYVTKSGHSW